MSVPLERTYMRIASPPYNNSDNANFTTFAQRSPNFPYNTGSNHSQIVSNNSSNTVYNHINAVNTQIKNSGGGVPYIMFKSDQERIKYLQGQMAAQTRALALTNPSLPSPAFPTPTASDLCTNVFSIINS